MLPLIETEVLQDQERAAGGEGASFPFCGFPGKHSHGNPPNRPSHWTVSRGSRGTPFGMCWTRESREVHLVRGNAVDGEQVGGERHRVARRQDG